MYSSGLKESKSGEVGPARSVGILCAAINGNASFTNQAACRRTR